MKRALLILVVSAFIIAAAGCGSSNPYTPPDPGDPRATLVVQNNCRFTVRLNIDSEYVGTISRSRTREVQVTPGSHMITLTGTDEDFDADIPVYFETEYTFENNEKHTIPVRFGVR